MSADNSLRVLHLCPTFHPAIYYGGPIVSSYGLCRALADAGHQVRVLTTDANGPDNTLDVSTKSPTVEGNGFEIQYCHRWGRGDISPQLILSLPSQLAWAQVVHLHAVYSPPTLPALALLKVIRRPLVWTLRGALQPWHGEGRHLPKAVWNSLSRSLLSSNTRLHSTSAKEHTNSLSVYPNADHIVVPNGVAVPEEIRRTPSNGVLRLLFLGRLHPIKGLENLIEGLGMLPSDVPWRLSIAGGGEATYEEKLIKLVEQHGLSERVRFCGRVERDGITELFRNHDVMVAPSFSENFGMSIAEALVHGMPAIVGKGAPWAGLEEHRCGLWIDNSPEKIARSIEAIHGSDVVAMGKRGRRWAREAFSWQSVAQQITAQYQELLNA